MHLVFDCNVLVSALLSNTSNSGKALLLAKSTSTLLISTSTLAELIEVLMRPKFDKYVSKKIRLSFIREIESLSTTIKTTRPIKVCRDPNDDMYLELAVSGKANAILTGDPDLLVLNPFENIAIITPKEFLDRYA